MAENPGKVFQTIWQGTVVVEGGNEIVVSVNVLTDPKLSEKQHEKLGKVLGDCVRDNLDKVIRCDCCD